MLAGQVPISAYVQRQELELLYSQGIENKVLSNTTHSFNLAMMSSTCPFLVMRTKIIGTQSIDTISPFS